MRLLLILLMVITMSFAYEDDIDAAEAFEMQKSGKAIIVDVRTTIEHIYTGHGLGFINIPLTNWIYIPKSIEARVKSAQFEIENEKVKEHKMVQKLYDTKEVLNEKFVEEVMSAMKLSGVESVVLVCRSGPRSAEAAEKLAKAGITAYNLTDGFMFGWKENAQPWGGF